MAFLKQLFDQLKNKNRNRLRARRDKKNRARETGQYSLAPFDNRKSIFVHIPKTGGISVSMALFGNLAGGHTRLSQYKTIFGEKDFKKYYKFTIVRNPWDRVFSAYKFLKAGGMNQEDAAWAKQHLEHIYSFEDFVINFLNEEVIQHEIHLVPQYEFVCDNDGNPMVDFVGRFESLQTDFNRIAKKVSPEAKLEHMNSSGREERSYQSAYTQDMQEKIARLYAKDIEIFAYKFGGEN